MIFIGQKLYGYCGGMFGRDSYGTKRIEAFGVDWIVAREVDGYGENYPLFAWFKSNAEMLAEVAEHSSEEARVRWEEDDGGG